MLDVFYKDDAGGELTRLNLSSDCPTELAEIHVHAKYYDWSPEFARVSNILYQKTGKVQNICIRGVDQITAGFLAFLILMSSKARKLSLSEILLNEGVCATLMAAITNPDGLTALRLEDMESVGGSFSENQLGLLFEAISTSSSLEHLDMMSHSECSMEACRIIARGLQRNRSLKRFEFFPYRYPNSVFQQSILSSALFAASLEHLQMADPWNGEHHITLSTLVEGLCREGCKLKSIDLSFEIAVDMDLANVAAENSSLLSLSLRYANLTCTQFVDFAMLFSSLQVLDITHSPISDLRPLGTLLLSEVSVLQRLDLSIDEVEDDEWLAFCEMIPRMKSLRSLGINNQYFSSLSEPQTRALLEALWQNTSLECFRVIEQASSFDDLVGDDQGRLLSKISVPLCFNRTGRRALLNRPFDPSLKRGLLALVLERATKLNYYSGKDNWDSPSLSSRRPDAIYWLLRESCLFEP